MNRTRPYKAANWEDFNPAYLALLESGELSRRADALETRLTSCDLCPRRCGIDRAGGKKGFCGVDGLLKVAAINLHYWEEPPISGSGGSGAIFFSGCTLECLFCQNYPISQFGVGLGMSADELASGMLRLQKQGAHNINLVTATHQMPGVVRALEIAAKRGLRIPLVYNCSGYESLDTLAALEDIIDIYLPDMKYCNDRVSQKLSGVADYAARNRSALLEMWRQVSQIRINSSGIALRGMMVRHLVLPENLSGASDCLSFLASEIGPEVWVSLMHQYFPAHKGLSTPPLNRKVTEAEYNLAFQELTGLGLTNGFVQDC